MMKKLRFSLLSMMMLLCGSVFSQTEFNFDENGQSLLGLSGESGGTGADAVTDGDITEAKTATVGAFSVTVSAAEEGNKTANRLWNKAPKLRLYSGTLTVSSTSEDIKTIIFTLASTASSAKWNDGTTASVGTIDASAKTTVTWTGNAKEVTFTIGGNTQISKITINGEASTTPDPQPQPVEEVKSVSVAEALAIINGLDDGAVTAETYQVTGYVISVTEISAQYGNATFVIADSKGASDGLTVFRVKGFDGANITNPELVKADDLVVVQGHLQKYVKDGVTTPEVAQKDGLIISVNGKTTDDTPIDPDPQPVGEVKTVSIADFNAAEESTDVWYQLTGIVRNLKAGDQYGNFDLEDETGTVYVYGLLSEKGGAKKQFQALAAEKGIVDGCKLTLIGNRGSYQDKIEVMNAYFVSVEPGEIEPQPQPIDEVKTVSIADFNAAEESTDVWYQLTGIVKNLKDGDQYGNFDLEDETGTVYVYGLLSEKGGEKKQFQALAAEKGIVNGCKLTLIGNRGSYQDKIEVMNAYFVSVEPGEPIDPDPQPVDEVKTVSIADFNAAEESTDVWYQLTGIVKNLKAGDQYGNFDLEDETGTVYVYGLLSEKGGEKKQFQALAAEKGIVNGCKLTLIGNRGSYQDKIEVMNAYFVSVEGGNPEPVEAKNVSVEQALDIVNEELADGENTSDIYRVTGFIVGTPDFQRKNDGSLYGNVNFDIADEKGGTPTLTIFRAKSYDDEAFTEETISLLQEGDEVAIEGSLKRYVDKNGVMTPELVNCHIITINGKDSGISAIEMTAKAGAIYNLSGQRVTKAVKGIYISNGRKMLVK